MRVRSLLLTTLASGFLCSAAMAADPFGADPIYNSPLFSFEGVYVGVQGGAQWNWSPAPGVVVADIGALAGANFNINEFLFAGVEFQGNAYIDMAGFKGYDALLLGHVGGYITDSAIIYAAAGVGTTNTNMVYALGAGIEAAVFDQVSARAEVLAISPWGTMPNGAKATLGLIWHMN